MGEFTVKMYSGIIFVCMLLITGTCMRFWYLAKRIKDDKIDYDLVLVKNNKPAQTTGIIKFPLNINAMYLKSDTMVGVITSGLSVFILILLFFLMKTKCEDDD